MLLATDHAATWGEAILPMLLVGGILLATGVFVVITAHRLADGRIAKNRIIGIRTRTTLSSDEAWAAAHQAGAPNLVRCGWASALTGPAAVGIGVAVGAGDADRALAAWGIALGVGIVALLWFAIAALIGGQRAAKAVQAETG